MQGFRGAILISLALAGALAQTSSNGPYTVSTSALQAHGFSFDSTSRQMCTISGPDGPCQVEAFAGSEKAQDTEGFTCRKIDRATYRGHCINGKLTGLSVVSAEGSAKSEGERVLAYFDQGRMAFPALTAFRERKLIGIREEKVAYGCVVFGEWDRSATRDRCPKFIKIWGPGIFSESTLQALKDGTLDLNRYGASFVKYISGQ